MIGRVESPATLVLDAEQESAVTGDRSRVVVLGYAGAGKTLVVVERIAHLLRTGVPKERIMLLAVSRRSADELSARLAARFGAASPTVSTFHTLAFTLVQQHYAKAGYRRPPRRMYAAEAWQELKRALEREDPTKWNKYGQVLRSRTFLALVSDLMAGAATNALAKSEIVERLRQHGRSDALELVEFRDRYAAWLKERCLLDLESAVLEALRLIENNPDVVTRHHSERPYLLVDDFEDATYVQARIAELLGGANLFVAGNPEEATDSYRGGSPWYLTEMAAKSDVRVVRLLGCHRTDIPLHVVSDRLFASAREQKASDGSAAYSGVDVSAFTHLRGEASWLVGSVASLLGEGTSPEEIAIIVRSSGDPVGREAYRGLLRMGVPVQAPRETVTVEQDPLVITAIDLLRFLIAAEPDRNGLFLALLASPLGELAPPEVRLVRRAAADAGASVLDLAAASTELDDLPPEVARSTAELASRLKELQTDSEGSPDRLLWRVWQTFPAFTRQALLWGEGRWEECVGTPAAYRAFLGEVARIVEDTPRISPSDIIRLFDAGHFRDVSIPRPTGSGSGIRITTAHQSRGMEWNHVFIPNLVEGVYPLRQSAIGNLAPLLLRCGDHEQATPRDRHLAEEKRVFYVALSRARVRAHLSFSAVALDGTSRLLPSRYLLALGLESGVENEPNTSATSVEEMVAEYRRKMACAAWSERNEATRMDSSEALYAVRRLAEDYPDRVDPRSWWENLDMTEGAAKPYPDGQLHLSASRLATYRDCPLAYMYGVHLRLEDISSDAASLGSLIHSVLEEYHRPGTTLPRSWDTLLKLLDRSFDAAAFSHPAVARQIRRKASELLAKYYSRYGQQGEAVGVEKSFHFALGPHSVSGRIDRIDRLDHGSAGLELIDYKTGNPMSFDDAKSDLQLALYALAFQHDPELAALGEPSLVTYLYPKGIGKRATTDGKRSYHPTEEGREKLLSRIDRYSTGILSEQFPSRFGILDTWQDLDAEEVKKLQKSDPCRYCGYLWLCPEQEKGTSND